MSGESKQIDEDENGPENGGMKSGPCLIAGFQPLTVVHPSYWNAYKTESGATFSNDVLRDAQRAADAWNRDHAAPQRTYRGRAR